LQARIAELQNQLNQVGGKGEGLSAPSGQESDSLYPSIRKLPLLGVTWTDLYRRVRVEEAVFETLTQQYELAKVEEAKEIPTVKVLDLPDVPEKKAGPPRMLIIILGSLFSVFVGIGWVLGNAKWQQTDPRDPGKALAAEVIATVKSNRLLARRHGPWTKL
jgi:capsule polysaccharide export protein KpsE/RkpR